MFNQWRCVLALSVGFLLLIAGSEAAELVVTERKDSVHFVLSAQAKEEVLAEKADFSLIYGLDVQIRQGETLYSLSGQDMEFLFPEVTTVTEGVLVGRSITKRQLAVLFNITQAGRYDMVTTLCLSDGVCLAKVESQLEFFDSDL